MSSQDGYIVTVSDNHGQWPGYKGGVQVSVCDPFSVIIFETITCIIAMTSKTFTVHCHAMIGQG